MSLATTIISDTDALERLVPDWHDLLRRSEENQPALTPTWLITWWKVFGSVGGRRLRIAPFWKGAPLVGFFPLLARRHWYPPAIPFRRLEPLGSGEDEADEVCSDYLGVIVDPASRAEVLA